MLPFLLLRGDASIFQRNTMDQNLFHCKLIDLWEMTMTWTTYHLASSACKQTTMKTFCNYFVQSNKGTQVSKTSCLYKTRLQRPDIHMHLCENMLNHFWLLKPSFGLFPGMYTYIMQLVSAFPLREAVGGWGSQNISSPVQICLAMEQEGIQGLDIKGDAF